MSSILPSQLGDLILAETSSTANVLVTQNAVEVLGVGNPEIRVTQNAVEVLGSANANIRTTQNAVEVLGSANPDIRVTQIAVEVLIPVEEPEPLPPFGYRGNLHQRHDTGQTNHSLSHEQPLNQWSTTKGIGFRRKIFAAFEPPPVISPFTYSTIRTCNC